MTRGKIRVQTRKLSRAEKREIERRERKYREKLARDGYTTQALVDESGCFGVVLVEERESNRRGLLLPDGKIRWMDEVMVPGLEIMLPGVLADAAVSGVTIDGLGPPRSEG